MVTKWNTGEPLVDIPMNAYENGKTDERKRIYELIYNLQMQVFNSREEWHDNGLLILEYLLKEIAYQMTDEERLNEIEEWKNKSYDFKILPLYLYDWILKYSIHAITDDLKADYYNRAVKVHEIELRRNFELYGVKQPYGDFLKVKANNFENISQQELDTITNIYKRIFINEYLKQTK